MTATDKKIITLKENNYVLTVMKHTFKDGVDTTYYFNIDQQVTDTYKLQLYSGVDDSFGDVENCLKEGIAELSFVYQGSELNK